MMRLPEPNRPFEHDPFDHVVWPGTYWFKRALRVGLYTLLVLLAGLFLLPLLWMIMTSLKPIDQVMTSPPVWVPREWQWENYEHATNAIPFWTYTWNTVKVCVLNVIGALLSTSLVAYGFACLKWPGRDKVFVASLVTLMIPFPVLMVPLFSIYLKLGWIGTLKPLWVPAFFGTATNIFLLRQYLLTIPQDLGDAARIDGAGEFRIFWQIVLPLARPALMIVGLFAFLAAWNDFIGPLIFLTDKSLYTLALGLQDFHAGMGGAPYNLLMAAGTLIVLPVFVLFFIFQGSFLRGVSLQGFSRR
ncbi:MAG: multiple sugar transport system permease protein [Candidatus Sumerlaeota bacterium]|nr:multiple sugar transport system permease protein [Candidatus Sumerlaeota bacterium]